MACVVGRVLVNNPLAFSRQWYCTKSNKSLRFSKEAILQRKEKKKQKRSLEHEPLIPNFNDFLQQRQIPIEKTIKNTLETLQINVGLTCNMSCSHCHVESTPTRTETLGKREANKIIELLKETPSIKTVDITGGAPEMHEQFEFIAKSAKELGKEVIDRCNLTILVQPGYEWIAPFLSENNISVAASMPCYSAENVNKQRGDKTFDQSIQALQILNQYGYGKKDSNLILNLIYNPIGPFLPPNQVTLEAKYKEELLKNFNIEFNELFTITNMPIKRFVDDLRESNKLLDYMNLLKDNFNPSNLDSIMCRSTIHVDYNGMISDCDFNSALEIPSGKSPIHGLSIFELRSSFNEVSHHPINFAKHCFGCVAGSGSS